MESPTKARKIQSFLGSDYVVRSSEGHIRDLDEKKLSIDIADGFIPQYVIPERKKKLVSELKKLAAASESVLLASDEDREGEAISWHLCETLGLDPAKTKRIVFHEITKKAILHAVENPRTVDMDLVNAQQARRILDRLVGFELSPLLWRKIQPKLSAGRVQSVALRLIVDREREIINFKKEAFYRVEAVFLPNGAGMDSGIKAVLDRRFSTPQEAQDFLRDCIGADFKVASVEKKEVSRTAAAPFTTSTLQQEAGRKLHLPVAQTMRIAQALYERGLITYMRTDSTNLSSLALASAKACIISTYGQEYSRPRQYATKSKGAQEAHEAIRPTYIEDTDISGTPAEKKLYALIWKRTVASQMSDARLLRTDIKIGSDRREEKFSTQADQLLFDGFMKVYSEGSENGQADGTPLVQGVEEGAALGLVQMQALCKYSQGPSRYTEPSLVKKLEELGIGRPSTYAAIVETLTKGRGYVVRGDKSGEKIKVTNYTLKDSVISSNSETEIIGAEKGRLLPQEIGLVVSDWLTGNFEDIMDYNFTATVESDFDSVAEGQKAWNSVISDFYSPFHAKVDEVLSEKGHSHVSREIGTDPSDGQPIVAKLGQWGPYVQKGEGDRRQFAKLEAGQLIETLTLEQALSLFRLPRNVGEFEGAAIVATKGRFGPYIKHGDKNYSLPKKADPLSVTLEECINAILEGRQKEASGGVIAEFGDIRVLNGRYGPYIKKGSKNYRIPKGTDAAKLTEQDCKNIISSK